jgi:hypothetical protein
MIALKILPLNVTPLPTTVSYELPSKSSVSQDLRLNKYVEKSLLPLSLTAKVIHGLAFFKGLLLKKL